MVSRIVKRIDSDYGDIWKLEAEPPDLRYQALPGNE